MTRPSFVAIAGLACGLCLSNVGAFAFAWKPADGGAFDVGVLSFCLSVAFVLCNDGV